MMKRRLIGLLVAVLLLSGCSSVLLTGRKQMILVSDAEVLSLSDSTYRAFMATATVSKQATQNTMVNRVGTRIANAVANYLQQEGQSALIDGYDWSFKLVVDTAVNAFCIPGGKIVVYEGLLPVTRSEAGLAVVIGHEVAHAIAKHANERMSQQMATSLGLSMIDAIIPQKQTLLKAYGPAVLGLGAEYGIMLPYSRKQEYEADHLGLIFMAMAGYDPAEALTFWSRMAANSTNTIPEILSTHPSDEKRIASIQKLLPEAQTYYKK